MPSASVVTRLQEIVAALCAPETGCKWDRAQTPESLCEYVLEESYELVEAIRARSVADSREELGDVFFLLFFLSHLFSRPEYGGFTMENTLSDVAAKMVRRHPHVFEGRVFANLDEQLREWEAIKQQEKSSGKGQSKGIYSSLPPGLPTLQKAYRIHSKAARAGFTWDSDEDAEQQLEAEWLEFLDALAFGDEKTREHEFGDYLFTLVEFGRRKGIKANAALARANSRFLLRFAHMEQRAAEKGENFSGLSMEEKNILWENAKSALNDVDNTDMTDDSDDE
jgi:MazG family protein